jgi:hypothetical protein
VVGRSARERSVANKDGAREFAKKRDANFEKARSAAGAAFTREFNPEAVLASPDKYLKYLFVKIGSKVVKDMIPQAKKTGKEYASGLGQTKPKEPKV